MIKVLRFLLLFLFFFSGFAQYYSQDTPEWFDGERVHIHTRYSIQRLIRNPPDSINFFEFEEQVARMGPKTYVRWIKGRGDDAWWNTAFGPTHDLVLSGGYPNGIADSIIQKAQINGLNLIGYFSQNYDDDAVINHPEWIAINRDGTQHEWNHFGGKKWFSFAFDDYNDRVIGRIKELINKGMKGVYFDHWHMPRDGDFSTGAQAIYTEMYGNPGSQLFSESDNVVEEVRQEILYRFFNRAVSEFKAVDPEFVMVASANSVRPSVIRKVGYSPKSEVAFDATMGGIRSASTFLLDLTEKYPHLWRNPTQEDSRLTYSRYLTYGTIYNRDIREDEASQVPDVLRTSYARLFDLASKIGEPMKAVSPYRFVRVLTDDDIITKSQTVNSTDTNMWDFMDSNYIPTGYYGINQLIDNATFDPNTRVLLLPRYDREYFLRNSVSTRDAQAYQKILDLEANGVIVLYKSQLCECNNWLKIFDKIKIPITLDTEETQRKGIVPYISDNGNELVINLESSQNNFDGRVKISKDYFPNITSVYESVTETTITPTQDVDYWYIQIPTQPIERMWQFVVGI